MSIAASIFLSILSVLLSFLITPIIRKIAFRYHCIDKAENASNRKKHHRATPLLGGFAVFLSFFIVLGIMVLSGFDFAESAIKEKHLIGIFIASVMLMIGGVLDDRYIFPPKKQIIFPVLAAAIVIASGIGITFITNPFGGQIRLDGYQKILFWFHGWPYKVTLVADVFTFLWLLGMMYTTKFLDGLDGLVSGVTVIGAVIIAALSFDPIVHQKSTALLALLLAGAFLGFLPWNWHPAKIFLGEGGSLLAGFLLGVLAIVAGSKVATTALVLGIPMLDVAWVIARRLFFERRSPFVGDRGHLHFRLLDIGFSHRKAVLLLYFLTAYFGIAALFLQSRGKVLAFTILSTGMMIFGVVLFRLRKRHT